MEEVLAAAPPQLPATTGRYVLSNCGIGPRVQVTDDPEEARQHVARDLKTWAHWTHEPGVTVVHVAAARELGLPEWQLWSDDAMTVGYWCDRGREHWPRSLSPVAEQVIRLVAEAGNTEARDRVMWQPLLTATDHQATTVDEAEEEGMNSGETAALVRHNVTVADGEVRALWDVVTGWWYRGEDADAGEEHWTARTSQPPGATTGSTSRSGGAPGPFSPRMTSDLVVAGVQQERNGTIEGGVAHLRFLRTCATSVMIVPRSPAFSREQRRWNRPNSSRRMLFGRGIRMTSASGSVMSMRSATTGTSLLVC